MLNGVVMFILSVQQIIIDNDEAKMLEEARKKEAAEAGEEGAEAGGEAAAGEGAAEGAVEAAGDADSSDNIFILIKNCDGF